MLGVEQRELAAIFGIPQRRLLQASEGPLGQLVLTVLGVEVAGTASSGGSAAVAAAFSSRAMASS